MLVSEAFPHFPRVLPARVHQAHQGEQAGFIQHDDRGVGFFGVAFIVGAGGAEGGRGRVVLELGLPEGVGGFGGAWGVEVGVEEEGAGGEEGRVLEESGWVVEEGGAGGDEEEAGEVGSESGEGAEGRRTAGFEGEGAGIGDELFEVVGSDVGGEAGDETARGEAEVGVAGVVNLDGKGGVEGEADVEDGVGEGVEGRFGADHDDALRLRDEGLAEGGKWRGVFGLRGVNEEGKEGDHGAFDVVVEGLELGLRHFGTEGCAGGEPGLEDLETATHFREFGGLWAFADEKEACLLNGGDESVNSVRGCWPWGLLGQLRRTL